MWLSAVISRIPSALYSSQVSRSLLGGFHVWHLDIISTHDWGFSCNIPICNWLLLTLFILYKRGRFVSISNFSHCFIHKNNNSSAHYNVILWKLSHKPTTNILINSKLTCLPIKSRLLLGFGPRQLFGSLAQSCYSKCLLAKYQQIRVKTPPRKMKATLSGAKIFWPYAGKCLLALAFPCLCVFMSLWMRLHSCLCASVFPCLCVCDCVFVCVSVCVLLCINLCIFVRMRKFLYWTTDLPRLRTRQLRRRSK